MAATYILEPMKKWRSIAWYNTLKGPKFNLKEFPIHTLFAALHVVVVHVSWRFQWLGKLLDRRYIMRSSADENHGNCNRGRLSRLLRSLQAKRVYCRRARSNSDEIESAFHKICHVLFPHWLRPTRSPRGNCIPALYEGIYNRVASSGNGVCFGKQASRYPVMVDSLRHCHNFQPVKVFDKGGCQLVYILASFVAKDRHQKDTCWGEIVLKV